MTVRRRLALPLLLALLVFVSTSSGDDARTPGAVASAWAIRVTIPNQGAQATPTVASPPVAQPATTGGFAYPADGSAVTAASTTASATTTVQRNAAAKAEADVTSLSLFKGELTADAITSRASAGTGYSGAGGNTNGSAAVNLRFQGQPVSGTHVQLADWGQLTVGAQTVDTSSPDGAAAYHATITELDVRLTADHGGLPAGSEIQVGYADVAAHKAPPERATTTTATTTTDQTTTTEDATAGDAPRLRPNGSAKTKTEPLKVHPKLTAGHYVFPVYGPTSYIDTFGASRADVTYHHGDDIFGSLGQPLVACTDGIVFSVGFNKIGGNRLWIVDGQGNQFYYAHLSAFATTAVNGAHVKAGQVVGFMGNTGDAEGTPYHLHFEVHPVSFLYLGYDGAVDPTPYLGAWQHQQDLPFPVAGGWVPTIPGANAAPEPGAILLGMNDISTADGLDPSSLERALAPVSPSALMQTLVPTVPAPAGDLGKG
ncbi:MAG TPA: M23 family metallopeptidase [Gaiellaceae bacterium]|nr:M23 family metallopeptidase [Gaiellaceae bacterium]